MKNQFLSTTPAILFYIVVFLVHFPSFSCQNNTQWYSSCANSFSCGGIRDVDYPFWGGNRPKECGHPGLELHCNSDTPNIKIMNVNYRVLEINPNTQILKISRGDLFGDICPLEFVNTTLDSQLFEFTSGYVNLTIQYGCPPLNIPVPHQLTCNINGITYQNGYIVPGAQGPGACRASIFIPIHSSSFGVIGELSNLKQLIEGGFEVRWKVDSTACSECKSSNGTCGYDLKTNRFTCLCPDDQPPGSRACQNVLVNAERSPQPSRPVVSEASMATLQKFKLLATQCAVAGSPTRSPTTSPVIHLRRRKTLRMLLSRGNSSGRRLPRRELGSPDRRGSDGGSPEKGKELVVSHKLRDLFVSSPPSFDERVPGNVRDGFSPPSGFDGGAAGGGLGLRRVGVGSLRPLSATFRQRLLRRAWRPVLVSIPE